MARSKVAATKQDEGGSKSKGGSKSNTQTTLMLSSSPSTSLQRGPLSLPLLVGLSSRPGAADAIVRDALDGWEAGNRIARWLGTSAVKNSRPRRGDETKESEESSRDVGSPPPSKRRRRGGAAAAVQKAGNQKRGGADEQQRGPQQQQQERPPRRLFQLETLTGRPRQADALSHRHWLIQGLASPSLPERQIATKILVQGCPLDDHSVWQVLEILVQCVREADFTNESISTCCISWVALIKHIVLNVLSAPGRLAFAVHPRMGVLWLSSILWRIACGTCADSSAQGCPAAMRVCLSVVTLLHPLVLVGRDKSVYEIHNFLWKSRSTKNVKNAAKAAVRGEDATSALSCLLGTYHLWREYNHKTAMEKYMGMLRQLVDPGFLPRVQSTYAAPVAADVPKGKQRLAGTFSPGPKSAGAISGVTHTHPIPSATNTSGSNASLSAALASSSSPGSNKIRNYNSSTDRASATTLGTNAARVLLGHSASSSSAAAAAAAASILESSSPPDHAMVASVARLFSSLYGSNAPGGGLGDEDADGYGNFDRLRHHDDDDDEDDDHDGDDDHDMEGGRNEGDADGENDDEDDNDDDEKGHEDEEKNEIKQSNEGTANTNEDKNQNEQENEDEAEAPSIAEDDDGGDEEIESDEEGADEVDVDDDEDDDEEEDDDDDDDDEDEIMIDEDGLPQLAEGLLERLENQGRAAANELSLTYTPPSTRHLTKERSQVFIQAAMDVLSIQHPPTSSSTIVRSQIPLSYSAEKALVSSIVNIIKPEKKPLNSKIILRRAPTQEEFFRGSLTTNPISLSMLTSRSGNNQAEPTVRDLRQHIANDLQMGDSAELLELLVANKILDVDLKLRVIVQVVWRDHLTQHSTSSSPTLASLLAGGRAGARAFLSSGSSLSLMVSSSLERSLGTQGSAFSVTAETPLSALPPMIVTYRLTGVDGEATEDAISNLNDPEAPTETGSLEEVDRLMEQQYGLTRLVMEGRGVFCLLRSVERNIFDTLRKIRRDSVGSADNYSRKHFNQSFDPGLSLLICCAKLPSNRKLLLQARAPTILLRLLLDVLHALEDDEGNQSSESNTTAKGLQELIEVLASDILSSNGDASSDTLEEADVEQDASTLRLLIQAIETSSLSRPLRNVIAKLLPYLTYGKPKLSNELAMEFMRHVSPEFLGSYEREEESEGRRKNGSVLMDTFIHTSVSLPANGVCNSLRAELVDCGFVERITRYILQFAPREPPSWSPSLWSKASDHTKQKREILEKQWKEYLCRPGLKTSFEMIVGLSKEHGRTQGFLGEVQCGSLSFLDVCHWLESTSDNSSACISMKGLGLLAETLLDDLAESETQVSQEIRKIRQKTRERKKEIAMERRTKTLTGINNYGGISAQSPETASLSKATGGESTSNTVREAAASMLAPVLGLFRDPATASPPNDAPESQPPSKRRKRRSFLSKTAVAKPAWMLEFESLEDESGLTCSVCQEGRNLQPSELLGLYAFVKKVSIPSHHGSRSSMDGTTLLTSLPSSVPASLQGTHTALAWFQVGKTAGDELKESARIAGATSSSVSNLRRATSYTTTVSAGNAIHLSCHERARQADRNHPKAPKSEWEGASLRNSRVNCNVILPLVSARSSTVSLVAVDSALTDHTTAVSNLLGARPKAMLWNVLHDVRLILLRMAYGEPLNADCGGGSLASNSRLIFYQLLMAKMYETEAQVDSPETSLHARALSAGFLSAREIISADGYEAMASTALIRGVADCAPMAALSSIAFHNTKDDYGVESDSAEDTPHPKRRWIVGKEQFLRGLLNCAGCRHALGIRSSGCLTGRTAGDKRNLSTVLADWENAEDEGESFHQDELIYPAARTSRASSKSSGRANIDDFGKALRPLVVFYAMMDQLSSDFTPNMDDVAIEESANRFVEVIESCQKAKSIYELLEKASVTLSHDEIIQELNRGMISA